MPLGKCLIRWILKALFGGRAKVKTYGTRAKRQIIEGSSVSREAYADPRWPRTAEQLFSKLEGEALRMLMNRPLIGTSFLAKEC